MFFNKKQKYQMDIADANSALQNILAACKQPPSSLPVDKILLRQKAKVQQYNMLLVVTALILLITFITPLCAVPFLSSGNIAHPQSHSSITLLSDDLADDILTLTFAGEGILFTESYLELSDGTTEAPLSYNEASNTICFTYHNTDINIYIPVENAPVYHLLISPQ